MRVSKVKMDIKGSMTEDANFEAKPKQPFISNLI